MFTPTRDERNKSSTRKPPPFRTHQAKEAQPLCTPAKRSWTPSSWSPQAPLGRTARRNQCHTRETKAGRIVVKPGCDMKSPHELWSDPVEARGPRPEARGPRPEARLDDLHRAKIRLADEVLVVGDHIGDSTRAEIAYARSLAKPVHFTHPEVALDT
ncbi:hypothetical protein [Streptomyces sp. NPDC059452]|uniref:hypothetical protein n=1 Tax=Streptomyces sp. NPDC059452 TaxID=3346835 RepID=UPI0036895EED